MSEESRGQQIRRNIKSAIEGSLSKYCPNTFSRMAYLIAYDFNLTPYTVKYNYLAMLLENGILTRTQNGLLDLSAKGKALQTTEDRLTDAEIKEEMEEDREKRKELEEFKKTRSPRKKPLEG